MSSRESRLRAILPGASRPRDALAIAERGLALARERGHRGSEAWTLRLLGEIVSRRTPPDVEAADGHYRPAMALAHELGMRPLHAHCCLGLGELHRHAGLRTRAREYLTTASAMYREMGMDSWLTRAEAAVAAAP
ncbi:MAG: hypothetical protein ACREJR_07835 [Candidatus Rokuibacteriota bacterium]